MYNYLIFEIPTERYFKVKVKYHCLQNSLLVEENVLLMKCLNTPSPSSLSLFFEVFFCFVISYTFIWIKLIFMTEILHWILLWSRGWIEFKIDLWKLIMKINNGAYSLNLLQTEYNFGGSKEHVDWKHFWHWHNFLHTFACQQKLKTKMFRDYNMLL